MKKTKTIIIVAAAFAACAVIGISILAVQRGGLSMVFAKPKTQMIERIDIEGIAEGRELLSFAESEEDARRIAELYGITFVKYADSVAEYTTDRELEEVIAEGRERGYPTLSINYIRKMTN